jgi:hypothetical protein
MNKRKMLRGCCFTVKLQKKTKSKFYFIIIPLVL